MTSISNTPFADILSDLFREQKFDEAGSLIQMTPLNEVWAGDLMHQVVMQLETGHTQLLDACFDSLQQHPLVGFLEGSMLNDLAVVLGHRIRRHPEQNASHAHALLNLIQHPNVVQKQLSRVSPHMLMVLTPHSQNPLTPFLGHIWKRLTQTITPDEAVQMLTWQVFEHQVRNIPWVNKDAWLDMFEQQSDAWWETVSQQWQERNDSAQDLQMEQNPRWLSMLERRDLLKHLSLPSLSSPYRKM